MCIVDTQNRVQYLKPMCTFYFLGYNCSPKHLQRFWVRICTLVFLNASWLATKKQMCIVDTQNQVQCLKCTFYFVGSFFPLNIYKDFGLKYAQLFFESKIACDKKQMCIVDAQNHIRCLKTVCFGYCCSPLVIY